METLNMDLLNLEEVDLVQDESVEDGDTRPIFARMLFRVEGFGNFTASKFNTATGTNSALFKLPSSVPLRATPATGWKFSHWLFNGNFGGTNAINSISAKIGLVITAKFEKEEEI